jgi:hypothetical protein
VQRTSGHATLPRFIGRWLPLANNPNSNNKLHGASNLLLFKPWRTLSELKHPEETFEDALTSFMMMATTKKKDMVENIQYYHDCWSMAEKHRDTLRKGEIMRLFDYEMHASQILHTDDGNDEDSGGEHDAPYYAEPITINKQQIEQAQLKQREERDRRFVKEAMLLAYAADIFYTDMIITSQRMAPFAPRATPDDMLLFEAWDMNLREMTRKQAEESVVTDLRQLHLYSLIQRHSEPSITINNTTDTYHEVIDNPTTLASASKAKHNYHPKLALLNSDQRRAHDIIERWNFGSM